LSKLLHRSTPATPPFEAIAHALATAGWGVFDDVVSTRQAKAWARRARAHDAYRHARVGRLRDRQRNRFVRTDQILWVDGADPDEQSWLAWAETLPGYLNRSLMLGLNSFESHFALYGPGTFYRRHVDAFQGDSNRVVSVVFYLNPGWQPAHGGELVIHDEAFGELGRVTPTLGTLAVFLSEVFPHEVLPTTVDRFSLAGWFRPRTELPLADL